MFQGFVCVNLFGGFFSGMSGNETCVVSYVSGMFMNGSRMFPESNVFKCLPQCFFQFPLIHGPTVFVRLVSWWVGGPVDLDSSHQLIQTGSGSVDRGLALLLPVNFFSD